MCSLAKENEITPIKCFEAKTINLLSYYEQMNRKKWLLPLPNIAFCEILEAKRRHNL